MCRQILPVRLRRRGHYLEEMFDLAATVEGLQGIELVGNWHINDDNADQIKKILKDRNLSASMVTPDLWTQEKWGKGSFTSRDPAIRRNLEFFAGLRYATRDSNPRPSAPEADALSS